MNSVEKMRDALKRAKRLFDDIGAAALLGEVRADALVQTCAKMSARLEEALAEPPRNCDVGTLEEQEKRISELCESFPGISCKGCQLEGCASCELTWAQMPYKPNGGAK